MIQPHLFSLYKNHKCRFYVGNQDKWYWFLKMHTHVVKIISRHASKCLLSNLMLLRNEDSKEINHVSLLFIKFNYD